MFVRLGFAVAAHVEPDVLLIDEVLVGGRREFPASLRGEDRRVRRDGRTIVFVSHGLGQVAQLCQDVAWIEKGELQMIGPAAEVIAAYQGESHQAERVEGEQGSRWGRGEAQIVGVELLDATGGAVSAHHARAGTIHVDITAHTPLQDTVVVVRIDSLCRATMSGGPAAGGTDEPSGSSMGRRRDVAIPSLPLLEGVYDLTVSLTDHTEVHPYDHWDRRIRFEVQQFKSYDHGLLSIPTEWTITGARGALQSGT